MSDSPEFSGATMLKTQGCLVVPIQEELFSEAALQFQTSILEEVHASSFLGVVIDLSGVKIVDGRLWDMLYKTSHMIKMLGFPTIITGFSPGIVASIIDLNLDIDSIVTAQKLEDALEMLTRPADEDVAEESDAKELDTNDPHVEKIA